MELDVKQAQEVQRVILPEPHRHTSGAGHRERVPSGARSRRRLLPSFRTPQTAAC